MLKKSLLHSSPIALLIAIAFTLCISVSIVQAKGPQGSWQGECDIDGWHGYYSYGAFVGQIGAESIDEALPVSKDQTSQEILIFLAGVAALALYILIRVQIDRYKIGALQSR